MRWRRWRVPAPVFWLGMGSAALWCQEFLGGRDVLVPFILVWLQRGRMGAAFVAAVLVTLVQEGLASFALGATLATAGLWAGFVLAAWRLDPFNPLFMAGFSLYAAWWIPQAYGTVAMLHDVVVPLPSFFQILVQASVTWLVWVILNWLVARQDRYVSVSAAT